MIKIKFLLSFFLMSLNLSFSHEIVLDTVQLCKGKKIFRLQIEKNGNEYDLKFINISKKNIYILPSNFENVLSGYKADKIEFGKNLNELSDIKYYYLTNIIPNDFVICKYTSNSSTIIIEVSLIFNTKIRVKEGNYYIKNFKYFKLKKKFVYKLPPAGASRNKHNGAPSNDSH